MRLETAIQKFFYKGYGKYRYLCSVKSVNWTENDSINVVENHWTDWRFSGSEALVAMAYLGISEWNNISCFLFKSHYSDQKSQMATIAAVLKIYFELLLNRKTN